jgi:hypothetical protein
VKRGAGTTIEDGSRWMQAWVFGIFFVIQPFALAFSSVDVNALEQNAFMHSALPSLLFL